MGYNSSCVGNIAEMFAPSRGFSQSCYWMTSDKFCHNWPWLPWRRNLRQNYYLLSHLMKTLLTRPHSPSLGS